MSRIANKIIATLFTAFPTLAQRWVDKNIKGDGSNASSIETVTINRELERGVPFKKLVKPLTECRVALITTAGVHLKSDKPFNMIDVNGDASYRVIPSSSKQNELMITHDYYNHSDADKDLNIVFPIDRLRELRSVGFIGSLSESYFGFMGHITSYLVEELINIRAEKVAEILKADNVDLVLLVPG